MANKAGGFIRPVRNSYRHDVCGKHTRLGQSIAEAFAREPKFYDVIFCSQCIERFSIKEFSWTGQPKIKVGE